MQLLVIGVSHRNTAIEERELFYNFIQQINWPAYARENLILHTCNRTEVYLVVADKGVLALFSTFTGQLPHIYCLEEEQAVRHILQVASGMESLVIGEVEILAQLKHSYLQAKQAKTVGKYLHRLLQNAFRVAKKVRSETTLSTNPISIASIAVHLASRIFKDFTQAKVLIVGAGKVAEVVLRNLLERGINKVLVVNRNLANAYKLLDTLNITHENAMLLPALDDSLHLADIVITATSSPVPIITQAMLVKAQQYRKHSPLYLLDLAVPRNIVINTELQGVVLFTIDDLHNFAKENTAKRLQATLEAKSIVNEEVAQFMEWYKLQDYLGTICTLRDKFQQEREKSLSTAIKQLRSGQDPENVVKQLAWSLVNKLLHKPTLDLKATIYETVITDKT